MIPQLPFEIPTPSAPVVLVLGIIMILYGIWTVWQRRSGSFDELRDHPRFYEMIVTFSGLIWLLSGIAFVAGSRFYNSVGEQVVGYAALFATVIFLLLFGLSLIVDSARRLRALVTRSDARTSYAPPVPASLPSREVVTHPDYGEGTLLSRHMRDGQEYVIVQFGADVITVPATTVIIRGMEGQATTVDPATSNQVITQETE